MEIGSNPAHCRSFETKPDWPNTAVKPRIATIVGRINGAPSKVINTPRPRKLRRAKARAAGMANATERNAESSACTTVNRTAIQSNSESAEKLSARSATATSVPKLKAATRAAAMRPGQSAIGKMRRAIRQSLHHARPQPHLLPKG